MTFNLFVRMIFRESLRSRVDNLNFYLELKEKDYETNRKAFLAVERERKRLAFCCTVIMKLYKERKMGKISRHTPAKPPSILFCSIQKNYIVELSSHSQKSILFQLSLSSSADCMSMSTLVNQVFSSVVCR